MPDETRTWLDQTVLIAEVEQLTEERNQRELLGKRKKLRSSGSMKNISKEQAMKVGSFSNREQASSQGQRFMDKTLISRDPGSEDL